MWFHSRSQILTGTGWPRAPAAAAHRARSRTQRRVYHVRTGSFLGPDFWVYLSWTDASVGLVCGDALLGSAESLASLLMSLASLSMLLGCALYSSTEDQKGRAG